MLYTYYLCMKCSSSQGAVWEPCVAVAALLPHHHHHHHHGLAQLFPTTTTTTGAAARYICECGRQ